MSQSQVFTLVLKADLETVYLIVFGVRKLFPTKVESTIVIPTEREAFTPIHPDRLHGTLGLRRCRSALEEAQDRLKAARIGLQGSNFRVWPHDRFQSQPVLLA